MGPRPSDHHRIVCLRSRSFTIPNGFPSALARHPAPTVSIALRSRPGLTCCDGVSFPATGAVACSLKIPISASEKSGSQTNSSLPPQPYSNSERCRHALERMHWMSSVECCGNVPPLIERVMLAPPPGWWQDGVLCYNPMSECWLIWADGRQ
jgi:hypothetical protein